MLSKPLCIDLFCGLGGWTEGFLSEGWDVVGFDVERHVYGEHRYPAQLVLQDVHTIHGSQFRNADCIVASPPCQEFSYMAMPWSRAKQIAAAIRNNSRCDGPRSGAADFPDGYAGSRNKMQLARLFDACFRIQREACEAAGRHIPMVVENVKGAQPWVGPAKANFGSFYFWGDVAMVGGRVVAGGLKFGGGVMARRVQKVKEYSDPRRNGGRGSHLTSQMENDRRMQEGASQRASDLLKFVQDRYPEILVNKQPVWFNDDKHRKCGGDWFGSGADCSLMRQMSSKSSARKAASAQIAKIPFPVSSYIARTLHP